MPTPSIPVVISCEHASNRVPEGVDLHVAPDVLENHVAWDEGARPIAEGLGGALGTSLFLGAWTRLLVDLNGRPTNPAVIPMVAFGVPVAGNGGLTEAEREERIARFHRPGARRSSRPFGRGP